MVTWRRGVRALFAVTALGVSGCSLVHQLTGPSSVAIRTFRATPPTITVGSQAVLTWDVSGADSVQIDNGIGTVESQGSRTITPNWSTTYVLSAHSGSLSTQASIAVSVVPGSPTPPPSPSPTPVIPTPKPPAPSPQPTPTPTPTPPSPAGPVAKARVGVIFVVCDNQGLPNSVDAVSVQVGCKVHMIVNLKDAHNQQTDAQGPINWHYSAPNLVAISPDPESPILRVLSAGDLTVWVTTDGVTSNDYQLHFHN
jgi:hypothetical protein